MATGPNMPTGFWRWLYEPVRITPAAVYAGRFFGGLVVHLVVEVSGCGFCNIQEWFGEVCAGLDKVMFRLSGRIKLRMRVKYFNGLSS